MGSVCLNDVQKILGLNVDYPYFMTYEENFEFSIDDVTVNAIAMIRWRYITIDIVAPFKLRAWTFDPPFMALGVMMVHRQAMLIQNGISNRDDLILRTKDAYSRHLTYLRLKPLIDVAQEEFLSVFREDIQTLETINANVNSRVAIEKSQLRRRLKSNEIDQKEYQIAMKLLSQEDIEARYKLFNLSRQVEMELEDIKHRMINLALSRKVPSALFG